MRPGSGAHAGRPRFSTPPADVLARTVDAKLPATPGSKAQSPTKVVTSYELWTKQQQLAEPPHARNPHPQDSRPATPEMPANLPSLEEMTQQLLADAEVSIQSAKWRFGAIGSKQPAAGLPDLTPLRNSCPPTASADAHRGSPIPAYRPSTPECGNQAAAAADCSAGVDISYRHDSPGHGRYPSPSPAPGVDALLYRPLTAPAVRNTSHNVLSMERNTEWPGHHHDSRPHNKFTDLPESVTARPNTTSPASNYCAWVEGQQNHFDVASQQVPQVAEEMNNLLRQGNHRWLTANDPTTAFARPKPRSSSPANKPARPPVPHPDGPDAGLSESDATSAAAAAAATELGRLERLRAAANTERKRARSPSPAPASLPPDAASADARRSTSPVQQTPQVTRAALPQPRKGRSPGHARHESRAESPSRTGSPQRASSPTRVVPLQSQLSSVAWPETLRTDAPAASPPVGTDHQWFMHTFAKARPPSRQDVCIVKEWLDVQLANLAVYAKDQAQALRQRNLEEYRAKEAAACAAQHALDPAAPVPAQATMPDSHEEQATDSSPGRQLEAGAESSSRTEAIRADIVIPGYRDPGRSSPDPSSSVHQGERAQREGSPAQPAAAPVLAAAAWELQDGGPTADVIRKQQEIHSVAYYELCRQVAVHCQERGRLMAELWTSAQDLLAAALRDREIARKEAFEAAGKADQLVSRFVVEVADGKRVNAQLEQANKELVVQTSKQRSELEGLHQEHDIVRHRLESYIKEDTTVKAKTLEGRVAQLQAVEEGLRMQVDEGQAQIRELSAQLASTQEKLQAREKELTQLQSEQPALTPRPTRELGLLGDLIPEEWAMMMVNDALSRNMHPEELHRLLIGRGTKAQVPRSYFLAAGTLRDMFRQAEADAAAKAEYDAKVARLPSNATIAMPPLSASVSQGALISCMRTQNLAVLKDRLPADTLAIVGSAIQHNIDPESLAALLNGCISESGYDITPFRELGGLLSNIGEGHKVLGGPITDALLAAKMSTAQQMDKLKAFSKGQGREIVRLKKTLADLQRLHAEEAQFMEAKALARRKRRVEMKPTPVQEFLATTWGDEFVGLGPSELLPKFLRVSGKVRYKRIPKVDCKVLAREIWAGKAAYDKERAARSALGDYIYTYLFRKYGEPTQVNITCYSLLWSLYQYRADIECNLFLQIAIGMIDEDQFFADKRQQRDVLAMLTSVDKAANSKVTGWLTKKELQVAIKGFYAFKTAERFEDLFDALDGDCPANIVNYASLFQEDAELSQTMFVEALRGQFLEEQLELLDRIEDFVLEVAFEFNTDKLGVKGLQMALQRASPQMDKAEAGLFVERAFGPRASQPGAVVLVADIMRAIRLGMRPEASAATSFVSTSLMQAVGAANRFKGQAAATARRGSVSDIQPQGSLTRSPPSTLRRGTISGNSSPPQTASPPLTQRRSPNAAGHRTTDGGGSPTFTPRSDSPPIASPASDASGSPRTGAGKGHNRRTTLAGGQQGGPAELLSLDNSPRHRRSASLMQNQSRFGLPPAPLTHSNLLNVSMATFSPTQSPTRAHHDSIFSDRQSPGAPSDQPLSLDEAFSRINGGRDGTTSNSPAGFGQAPAGRLGHRASIAASVPALRTVSGASALSHASSLGVLEGASRRSSAVGERTGGGSRRASHVGGSGSPDPRTTASTASGLSAGKRTSSTIPQASQHRPSSPGTSGRPSSPGTGGQASLKRPSSPGAGGAPRSRRSASVSVASPEERTLGRKSSLPKELSRRASAFADALASVQAVWAEENQILYGSPEPAPLRLQVANAAGDDPYQPAPVSEVRKAPALADYSSQAEEPSV